jgi:hypothetical protein
MTKAIKTLKQLKGTGLPDEPPKLETEPPHRRLQRLTAEQERLTREIQEHRLAWANRNQMAAQTRQPPSTAEITGFKEYHRDLSCRLAAVNLEIGTTNREIRQHKAEVAARKAKPADVQPARNGVKKTCPLRDHPSLPQYVMLAIDNELEPGLRDQIIRSAKGMLDQALKTGIEQ